MVTLRLLGATFRSGPRSFSTEMHKPFHAISWWRHQIKTATVTTFIFSITVSLNAYNLIRKSKDYVYGIWVYKVLGIWKGYYRVNKSLVSCMKRWTEANNKYMKYHSKLTYQLSFWNVSRKVDYIAVKDNFHFTSSILLYGDAQATPRDIMMTSSNKNSHCDNL